MCLVVVHRRNHVVIFKIKCDLFSTVPNKQMYIFEDL